MSNYKGFKPLREYVLVKPLPREDKKVGSILLPGTADQDKFFPGEVMAVGTGYISADRKKITPLEVKVGDMVLFSNWVDRDVTIKGVSMLVMEEADIKGVIS